MYLPDFEEISFIKEYMNENQPAALLAIAKSHGHDADSARLEKFDSEVFELTLQSDQKITPVTIGWPRRLTSRTDIRNAFLELQEDARLNGYWS